MAGGEGALAIFLLGVAKHGERSGVVQDKVELADLNCPEKGRPLTGTVVSFYGLTNEFKEDERIQPYCPLNA